MSDPIKFLNTEDLEAIHRRMIDDFGGSDGLRDRHLLESATHTPQAQFGGQFLHASVAAMSAAYLFHLCKNHPFVDGNKRVALATAIQFLFLNDHRLVAGKMEVEALTIGVADSSVSKEEATAFFVKHTRRDQPNIKKVPRRRK